jgi:hypothetical protein
LGTPSLFFTLNLAFVHHSLVSILGGKGIILDVWFDPNLPDKNKRHHLVATPYNYLTSYTRFVTSYLNSFDLACFQ